MQAQSPLLSQTILIRQRANRWPGIALAITMLIPRRWLLKSSKAHPETFPMEGSETAIPIEKQPIDVEHDLNNHTTAKFVKADLSSDDSHTTYLVSPSPKLGPHPQKGPQGSLFPTNVCQLYCQSRGLPMGVLT